MKPIKNILSDEQLQVLQELIAIHGIGRLKATSLLDERQIGVIKELQSLGYARVYKRRPEFMVLMKPRADQI